MSREVGRSTSKTFETNGALLLLVCILRIFIFFELRGHCSHIPFSIVLLAALEMDALINQLGGKFVVYHLLIFHFTWLFINYSCTCILQPINQSR